LIFHPILKKFDGKARVRNNSGPAGEVSQWESEKTSPPAEMKVFKVFSVAGPELFPDRNCS
jgi:hypothetical protein